MRRKLLLAFLGFVFLITGWANAQGSIGVLSPNGGEEWFKGSTQTIRWYTEGLVGRVTIVLLKGDRIVSKIHKFQSTQKIKKIWSFSWRIPSNTAKGKDYKVQFLTKKGAKFQVLAQSKGDFSIMPLISQPRAVIERPAIVTVTSPNGGEKVLRPGQYAIWWIASKSIGNPTIEIKKGGVPVETHAAVTPTGPFPGNKYKWTWNIGAGVALGDNYRVTVTGEGGSPTDESNDDFSLVDKKIDVTMPRAGSTWPRRSRQTIRFRCTNITQNLRIRVKAYPGAIIAENVHPTDFEVVWHTAGVVGDLWLPAIQHVIIVETMDGTVQGESHPVFIPE
jgi:hypothetical protein